MFELLSTNDTELNEGNLTTNDTEFINEDYPTTNDIELINEDNSTTDNDTEIIISQGIYYLGYIFAY